jgi:hypothetical protein
VEANAMVTHSGSRQSSALTIRYAILAALMLSTVTEAAASDGQPLHRVRSEDPAIAAVIRGATERSATFRHLIERINATDGLVYVEEGKCRRSVRACLLLSVKVAGPYRLLRILVDTRKTAGIELMGSIGHELQHAIEVLSNPRITDSRTLYQFYDRVAPTDNDSFETQEAMKAGLDILNELYARRRH